MTRNQPNEDLVEEVEEGKQKEQMCKSQKAGKEKPVDIENNGRKYTKIVVVSGW